MVDGLVIHSDVCVFHIFLTNGHGKPCHPFKIRFIALASMYPGLDLQGKGFFLEQRNSMVKVKDTGQVFSTSRLYLPGENLGGKMEGEST